MGCTRATGRRCRAAAGRGRSGLGLPRRVARARGARPGAACGSLGREARRGAGPAGRGALFTGSSSAISSACPCSRTAPSTGEPDRGLGFEPPTRGLEIRRSVYENAGSTACLSRSRATIQRSSYPRILHPVLPLPETRCECRLRAAELKCPPANFCFNRLAGSGPNVMRSLSGTLQRRQERPTPKGLRNLRTDFEASTGTSPRKLRMGARRRLRGASPLGGEARSRGSWPPTSLPTTVRPGRACRGCSAT